MTAGKPISVAIVGGGIGGLCLAVGLLHHSHLRVSVYEAALAFGDIGAGVAIGPNAQRALKLICSCAGRAFGTHATPNTSPEFARTWFEFRSGVSGPPSGLVFGKLENSTGQQTVHRARFLDELASLIPDDVAHFGKRLIEVQQAEEQAGADGPITLRFADGSAATADCVIGADGVHSVVRKAILGASQPTSSAVFSGIVAYRGLIPMEVARKELGHFVDDAYMWCGGGGMIMTYPIDSGSVLNVVAARDGKDRWDEEAHVVQSSQKELMKEFDDWVELPRKVIQLIERPTLWAMLHHPPAPSYYSGKISMMGDAAHATTPFQGAGAGQAIEDALVLSVLLGHVKTRKDIETAFASYDAVRRPRTQKVVTTSYDAMRLYAFTDGFVDGDAGRWREVWENRMNWLWDINLETQNDEALRAVARFGDGASVK